MNNGDIKIIAPLSSPNEARTLPRLGADELYFSIQPHDAAGAVSRRELPHANFRDLEDVELAVAIAEKRGASLFVALNKTFYVDEELPKIKRLLDCCLELKVAGAIIADPGLLNLLHREKYHRRAEIVLSVVAAPQNCGAIDFYRQFGISRAILPRNVSPKQAALFVKACPDLMFETLIFNWHCINLDGVCRFQHENLGPEAQPVMTCNGCCLEYEIQSLDGSPVPDSVSNRFDEIHRRSEAGCAACSIWDFAEAGIKRFKIAGRLLDVRRKEDSVRFISDCVRIFGEADDREKYIRLTNRHYENFFKKACDGACYHNIRKTV